MEILRRYLYQVEKYLPLKDRKDTIDELKSLILEELDSTKDMFASEDEALHQVLLNLGEPKEVARKYINDAPLISKEMEPILFLVLKIASLATAIGILFANMLELFSSSGGFDVLDVLIEVVLSVPEIISAIFSTVGVILIIFILVERYVRPNIPQEQFAFDPSLLPVVPEKMYKISLFEEIVTIFGSVLIIYLLNYQSGLISIYFEGNRLPLLNENFNRVLPLLNANVIFGFIIAVVHLIKKRKTFITKLLTVGHNFISGVTLLILASSNIFNDAVIDAYDLSVVPTIFKILMIIGGIGSIIAAIVELVKVLLERSGKEEYIKDYIEKN